MATNHEKLVTAYLDGELSAAEAAEFDQSLTPEHKANLAGEIKFERAIGERLARAPKCPDDLWQRTMAAVEAKAAPVVVEFKPRPNYWKYATVAMAAMLTITTGGLLAKFNNSATVPAPSMFTMQKGTTIEMLASQVDLHGHDTAAVNAYFKEHGFNLEMTSADMTIPGDHHTPRELLGMRPATNGNDNVMEMMFNCCGRPLKVVIAKTGSDTAREIGELMSEGKLQTVRHVGDYVAALVGKHETHAILDNFTEPEKSA